MLVIVIIVFRLVRMILEVRTNVFSGRTRAGGSTVERSGVFVVSGAPAFGWL